MYEKIFNDSRLISDNADDVEFKFKDFKHYDHSAAPYVKVFYEARVLKSGNPIFVYTDFDEYKKAKSL